MYLDQVSQMALGGPEIPPKVVRKAPKGFGTAEWNIILQIWTLKPRRHNDFPGMIDIVQQSSGIWTCISVVPSDGKAAEPIFGSGGL